MSASLTIITSTFNCREALEQTAASIREQTQVKLQWIIADGGSTDGTLDVIYEQQDIVSHWFSEQDSGIYDAWNKATVHVANDWVMFLGAGDLLFSSNSLHQASHALGLLSEADTLLAYGGVALVDKKGENIQFEREVNFSHWRQGRPVLPCHQGVFHHRSLIQRPQPFDSSLRICADAKLMLQAVAKKPAVYLFFDVAKMVAGGISTAPEGWIIAAKENRRICDDLGLHPPLMQRIGMIRLYAKLMVGMALGRHVAAVANAYRRLTGRKPLY